MWMSRTSSRPVGMHAEIGPSLKSSPGLPSRIGRPVLMVRSLDFTVKPGRTYRYRERVVLFNPHFNQGILTIATS